MVTQNFWFMMQTKAGHTVLYNVYPYIRLSRERLGFYAKIQIIFGTVHVPAICQGKFWVQVLLCAVYDTAESVSRLSKQAQSYELKMDRKLD